MKYSTASVNTFIKQIEEGYAKVIQPFYYEIKDRNVNSGRFMKCSIIVSHCVVRYTISNIDVLSKSSVVKGIFRS